MLYRAIVDAKQVTLKNIINCIRDELTEYNWSIFEFDGMLSSKSKFNINAISDAALKNKAGYQMTGNALSELASDIEQTYDLILAGKHGLISEFNNTDKWREGNNLVIEMVDCGNWEICSTDGQLLSKFKCHLHVD